MPFFDAFAPASGGASLADMESLLDRRLGQENVDHSSPYPTTACPTGIANTFGAWQQIVATVGGSAVSIIGVWVTGSPANADFEIEIGTGAGGAEVRAFGVSGYFAAGSGYSFFPITGRYITAGTRLSARARDSLAALDNYAVSVVYRLV